MNALLLAVLAAAVTAPAPSLPEAPMCEVPIPAPGFYICADESFCVMHYATFGRDQKLMRDATTFIQAQKARIDELEAELAKLRDRCVAKLEVVPKTLKRPSPDPDVCLPHEKGKFC